MEVIEANSGTEFVGGGWVRFSRGSWIVETGTEVAATGRCTTEAGNASSADMRLIQWRSREKKGPVNASTFDSLVKERESVDGWKGEVRIGRKSRQQSERVQTAAGRGLLLDGVITRYKVQAATMHGLRGGWGGAAHICPGFLPNPCRVQCPDRPWHHKGRGKELTPEAPEVAN